MQNEPDFRGMADNGWWPVLKWRLCSFVVVLVTVVVLLLCRCCCSAALVAVVVVAAVVVFKAVSIFLF